MSLSVAPIMRSFAAEITNLDLGKPIDPATVGEFITAMDRYAVCVCRNEQPPTDEQHLAFSLLLGPVERGPILKQSSNRQNRIPLPEIIDVSNLDKDGKVLAPNSKRLLYGRANQLWHTDVSFHAVRATYSLLAAHVVPQAGGDTEFADLRAAYDALSPEMKMKIENLEAEHSYWYSRAVAGGPPPNEDEVKANPPARHRLVHVHPGSGRKTLYLASHASHIVGMPVVEGRALLDELTELATQRQFVYRHTWRVGDLVVWDNRCTLHRATAFADTTTPRDVRRTTVREGRLQLEALDA